MGEATKIKLWVDRMRAQMSTHKPARQLPGLVKRIRFGNCHSATIAAWLPGYYATEHGPHRPLPEKAFPRIWYRCRIRTCSSHCVSKVGVLARHRAGRE